MIQEPEQPPVVKSGGVQEKYPLASRIQRLLAVLLDEFLTAMFLFPLIIDSDYMESIQRGEVPSYQDGLLLAMAQVLIFILLHSYLLSRYGQTIGKRIVGIAIVDFDSGRILKLGKLISLRYVPIWIASIIPLTSLIVPLLDALFIFRPDRRCIHDHIANTRVINVKKPNY